MEVPMFERLVEWYYRNDLLVWAISAKMVGCAIGISLVVGFGIG